MGTPQIIIARPYEASDTLVEHDAWIVGRSDILLLGADDLPAKTLVAFEIRLQGGEAVIQGEGWAMHSEPDDGAGTGGLRIKLRTLDRPSKALLRRMLDRQKKGLAKRPEPPSPEPEATEAEAEEEEAIPISVEIDSDVTSSPEPEQPAAEAIDDDAPAPDAERPTNDAPSDLTEAAQSDDEVATDSEEPTTDAEGADDAEGVDDADEIEEVTVEELGGSWFPPGVEPPDEDVEPTDADDEPSLDDTDIAAEEEMPPPLAAASDPTAGESIPSNPEPSAIDASPEELEIEELRSSAAAASPPPPVAAATLRGEESGVRHRPAAPVKAPENREELLERLRARAHTIAKAKIQESSQSDEAAS
jgi:hypothetical protein